ncbi:MAG: serine hydrolase, partial [Yoonia sp.]
MRRVLKWGLRVVLALAIAAVVAGIWKRDQVKQLLAVNSLFSAEKIVNNFSHMDTLFTTVPVPRGNDAVVPLPIGAPATMPDGVAQWIVDRDVTALVVLKDGTLVHEDYFLGTTPEDLRVSWSVAKSFLSALMGIVLEDGEIKSIDDQVTDYVPMLIGSAYDGATIKDVLQMSSGVVFNEDYLDFNSDINKMGRVLALGGSMDTFAASLDERFVEPGTVWQYVSIDTHVVGMVIRGATGRTIPELLTEKIFSKMGFEADPYYVSDGYGVAFVLGGLNLRTRDYARFGQMIANGGAWNGQQIVPRAWIAASTKPSANTATGEPAYGYQWWIHQGASAGEFNAQGVYGQYIFIDTARDVVIAVNSADKLFKEEGASDQNFEMMRTIA